MIDVEPRRQDLAVPFETATVGDAMSNGVISCPPETPLRVVARMMATFGVHAIFVFERDDEEDPVLALRDGCLVVDARVRVTSRARPARTKSW